MVLSVTELDALFGSRTATIVEHAIDPAHAVAVRADLTFARFALVDRGSYDVAPVADVALFALLADAASRATGRTLAVTEARALRLGPGDYLLAHHDRIHADLPVEAVLDLSPAAVPGAELHYRRRGQVFFRFPSMPCALAIVERGPTVTSNHTYVSKLHPSACVVRIAALLRQPAP